jgi:hypothetical protein
MWRFGLRIAEALALEVKDLNFDVHAGGESWPMRRLSPLVIS